MLSHSWKYWQVIEPGEEYVPPSLPGTAFDQLAKAGDGASIGNDGLEAGRDFLDVWESYPPTNNGHCQRTMQLGGHSIEKTV